MKGHELIYLIKHQTYHSSDCMHSLIQSAISYVSSTLMLYLEGFLLMYASNFQITNLHAGTFDDVWQLQSLSLSQNYIRHLGNERH